MHANSPLVLLILDGFGHREPKENNALAMARMPQWDSFWQNSPHILLDASGKSVGLPASQMGNSEVGHMHIGAGRLIEQDLTRINHAIEQGTLKENPVLKNLFIRLKRTNSTLHLMGLLSPGGVHSQEQHLFALLQQCHQEALPKVCIHLFLDGRDTPPKSALDSIERLEKILKQYPNCMIGSVCGRYYAMDRDERWERIEPAYRLLTEGQSAYHFVSAKEAINAFYQDNITDEFIPPTKLHNFQAVTDNDAILFFNFRADRARQLTSAFIKPDFKGFTRREVPKMSSFITMTRYSKDLDTEAIFPPVSTKNTLGEVIANHGLRQLRIAETEKYAHVTYFFNGGNETVFTNEDRILIPSPKVATYDLQPQMSAPELTDAIVKAIQSQNYDVIICNYANADMVGHSGNLEATIAAIECLDQCMQRIHNALAERSGNLLITADHGNAEEMFNPATNQPHTAHTTNPVPFVFVGKGWHFKEQSGSLVDVAPTILALLGIKPPLDMTGHVLLEKNQ